MSESTRALCQIIARRPFITLSDEELAEYIDVMHTLIGDAQPGVAQGAYKLFTKFSEEHLSRQVIPVITAVTELPRRDRT